MYDELLILFKALGDSEREMFQDIVLMRWYDRQTVTLLV